MPSDRIPSMDGTDVQEFAFLMAVGGLLVGAGLGLAVWLLPGVLAAVVGVALLTAAGLGLVRAADRWWRANSAPEPAQTDGEGSANG